MPKVISSSSDDEKENSSDRSPIKKRSKRSTSVSTKDLSEEPAQDRSKRNAAIAAVEAITTKPMGRKGTKKFLRSPLNDTTSTTDGLSRIRIESSSSSRESSNPISSSRESSMGPPKVFDYSSSSSSGSSTTTSTSSSSSTSSSMSSRGSQLSNKSSTRSNKSPLSNIGEEEDEINVGSDGIVRIKFNNLDPIGPDDAVNSSSDEEEEFSTFNMLTIAEDSIEIPPIVPDDPSGEYEVERILLVRRLKKDTKYLLKWKNYPLNQMSWERQEKLIKCPKVLKNFEDRIAVCESIYNSLPNKDEYKGYKDTYITNIITPSFIQQNMFEDGIVEFMQNNNFGPLAIENWTRFTDVLPKFTWVAESVFSYPTSLAIEKFEESEGCNCNECEPDRCPCVQNTITKYGHVRANRKNFIKECNKNCGCSSKCPSKVLQRGRTLPLMLFRTPKCGWSVRTMVPIPAKRFVVEYVGLIKLVEECEDIEDQTYLFNCDLPDDPIKYVIDATEYGNESRFINHNCDPNLEAYSVLGYHNDPSMSRIIFHAARAIEAGEELTFNYFPHELDMEQVDPTDKRVCRCGAGDKCRKFLF